MDRGLKIAIIVACLVALSLGLIWDQVLRSARVIVERAPEESPFQTDSIKATVGSGARVDFPAPAEETPQPPKSAPDANAQPTEPVQPPPNPQDDGWIEYTPKYRDSWWSIANRVFKSRGLSSTDIAKANPGFKDPMEGRPIMIPPAKR